MSGVAAAIRVGGGPAPISHLRAMIDAAPHRAPDGVGLWQAGGAALAKLHRFVFAEQRASGQPAIERDGPHCVIFDGRLDNRNHLAQRFPDASLDAHADDAAYALAAMARLGAGAAEALDGDFAVVAWNGRTRTVVAARDRLGIRPLYWAIDEDVLLVATDIAQVLAALSRQPPPDETVVSDLLAFEPGTDERTLYAGVQRVPPGHVLVVDARGPRLQEYWRPVPRPADERRSDDDYADQCREILLRAVGARLRARDRTVLCFSGGIDSSSILAAAIDVAPSMGCQIPQPLSVVFEQPESDEREYRQAFSAGPAQAAIPAVIDVGPCALDAAEYVAQARRRRLPPDVPSEFVGQPMMARARALGARAALTGAGGDYLFSGSTLQYADLIRRGRVPAAIGRYLRDWKTSESGWSALGLLTEGVWPLLPQRLRDVIRQPARRAIGLREGPAWLRLPRPGRRAVPDPPPGVSHASWEICWTLGRGWTAFFLDSSERGASEAQLDLRHPLLDPAVVDFALSLPERQRRRGQTIKYVLRRAAHLPPAIGTRRTKADFGHVMQEAFAVLGGRRFFETLQIADAGWVDAGQACKGYDVTLARSPLTDVEAGSLLPRLWILAAVELWYREVFGRSEQNESAGGTASRRE